MHPGSRLVTARRPPWMRGSARARIPLSSPAAVRSEVGVDRLAAHRGASSDCVVGAGVRFGEGVDIKSIRTDVLSSDGRTLARRGLADSLGLIAPRFAPMTC